MLPSGRSVTAAGACATELEAREATPGGMVGSAEAIEDHAGCRVRVPIDDDPGHVDTVHEAPRPVVQREPLADVVGHHRCRVRVRLDDVDGAAVARDVPPVREGPWL